MTKTTYKFTRLPDQSHEPHPASREKNQRDSRQILEWLATGAFVFLAGYFLFSMFRFAMWADAASGAVK